MSLKPIKILFKTSEEFTTYIEDILYRDAEGVVQTADWQLWDYSKHFWTFMTINKIEILVAISKYHPGSVYELAQKINREPHHVLKDCNSLEVNNFIKYEKNNGTRGQKKPVLIFNYDFIEVQSQLGEVVIVSEKARSTLLKKVKS